MRETVFEQIASDRREPDQVRSRLGVQEDVRTPSHFVLAQIGHDKFLAVEFVSALYARGEHGMALRRVAANDQHETRVLDVVDGAGIATVADGAKQPHGGGRLAIAGAVVDVIGTDNGARQFLHEVALFVCALRGRDEGERVWSVLRLDFGKFARHQVESLVPTGLAELVALANQRLRQAVRIVDVVPSKLSFDASGDSVCGAFRRLDLQDMTVLGPDIEAATDSAICAHGLGAADARLAHGRFDLRYAQDGTKSSLWFDALDDVDHGIQRSLGNARKESGVPEHGLFHQRIARTDRDAVAAGDATGLADGRTAVPQNARMRVVPIDGKRLVHFDVLASFHAAAAQDALVGIVTIEGICVVNFVRFGLERDLLMLDG